MTWFAILLVVIFGLSAITHLRKAGGLLKEKQLTTTEHKVEAVACALLVAGILAWLL